MAVTSFARTLLGSAALMAPFCLATQATASLVAPLSHSFVAALLGVTAPLATTQPPLPQAEPSESSSPQVALSFDVATKSSARRVVKAAPLQVKPSALFVSQSTVLKLAQSSARPRGSFVGQSAQHPAGLRLSGVAALGIGVQDGDILVEALGITPHGPGEIIGAIIEARAKQARYLSGTLWRQGQTFPITVEQPYLPERS